VVKYQADVVDKHVLKSQGISSPHTIDGFGVADTLDITGYQSSKCLRMEAWPGLISVPRSSSTKRKLKQGNPHCSLKSSCGEHIR